jgi:hypothetical protein
MKVGDLVKWVGYPGASDRGIEITNPVQNGPGGNEGVGIVVAIHESGWLKYRIDVSWSDGSFGNRLYPQTLEVINETN